MSKVYCVLRANETSSVLPHHRHVPSLLHLTEAEKLSFANILSLVTKRYDNLFLCSFAYSMGIHQRPTPSKDGHTNSDDEADIAHLHVHFFPPLLRSASVRKFLVGYVFCLVIDPLIQETDSFELMAEAQRDITPEQAASRLRACSEVHYLDN